MLVAKISADPFFQGNLFVKIRNYRDKSKILLFPVRIDAYSPRRDDRRLGTG